MLRFSILGRLALAAALIAGAAASAPAADLAYKAASAAPIYVTQWGGWYLGANAGYGNSYKDTSVVGTDAIGQVLLDTGALPSNYQARQDGWLGGAQLGYNFQFGQWVLGLETDFQWSGIKGSASQTLTTTPLGLPITLTGNTNTELNWFGTLRPRLGFLVSDRALFYATGGLAYGEVTHASSAALTTGFNFNAAAAGSQKDTQVGWTIGGGVEYALLPNVRLKAEYLYVDLGNIGTTYSTNIGATNVGFTSNVDLTYHVVRGGINFAF